MIVQHLNIFAYTSQSKIKRVIVMPDLSNFTRPSSSP